MRLGRRDVLGTALVLVLAASAPRTAQSASPRAPAPSPAPPQALLDTMLEAIKTGAYDTFMASASAQMKAGLSKAAFDAVSAQLAPRLRAGYKPVYLGELQQQGHRVHLWKLSFKDGQDDALVKLAMKDGVVGGFWIQ
jgi:hypothetical protein